MLTSILLASMLNLAPPAADPTTYEQSRAALESATVAAGDLAPEEAIAALEAALADVVEHPRELLHDAQTSEAIRRARVILAWLHLALDDRQAAADAMDEALRGSSGPLPINGLGPNIRKLHDERLAALKAAGTATIEVKCESCDILIDEGKASESSEHFLGPHRVWLFDPLGEIEPRYEVVNLDTADAALTVVYEPAPPPDDKPSTSRPRVTITTKRKGRQLSLLRMTSGAVGVKVPANAKSEAVCDIPCGSLVDRPTDAFFIAKDGKPISKTFQLGSSASTYEIKVRIVFGLGKVKVLPGAGH